MVLTHSLVVKDLINFILDDTPTEDFKKQWILNNPEDEELLNSDNIFRSEDIIKDFQIGVDVIDLTAISSFNVDLSSNTDNNDLSIRNKDENKFDAVMEIITENVNVSITLENFGSITDNSEEAFYHQSLYNPKKENKLYRSYLTIIVML